MNYSKLTRMRGSCLKHSEVYLGWLVYFQKVDAHTDIRNRQFREVVSVTYVN